MLNMSMPVIKHVKRLGYTPAEWELTTVKEKKVFVRYIDKEIKCRLDSMYQGEIFLQKQIKNAPYPNMMNTYDMLEHTKFRMNHDMILPPDKPSTP